MILDFLRHGGGDVIPEWAKNIGKKWVLQNEENEIITSSTSPKNHIITSSTSPAILNKVEGRWSPFIRMIIRLNSYITKILGAKWSRAFIRMLIRFIIIKWALP